MTLPNPVYTSKIIKRHEIRVNSVGEIIINEKKEQNLVQETMENHGIEKNDLVTILIDKKIIYEDSGYIYEIYNKLKEFGCWNVDFSGKP